MSLTNFPLTGRWPAVFFLSLFVRLLMSQASVPPPFDNVLNLDGPGTTASGDYDPETGTVTLTATSGTPYLWSSIQGDFILRAEVDWAGEAPAGAEAGWAVRDHLGPDAPAVTGSIGPDKGATLASGDRRVKATTGPVDVIELSRLGDTFRLRTAAWGQPLDTVDLPGISLRNEAFVGVYVRGAGATVRFRNVRIVRPAPADLTPYRDYLGSRLEILDLETGVRKVIHTSAHSLQAPNWTPDGEQLIFNSNGFLYTYALGTGEIRTLNTGPQISNNNDHVLSPDGSLLGISSHVAAEDGASTIFVLPVAGSDAPQRVTLPDAGHSYLHAISPDKRTVIFTGQRNGKFDIWAADIETGAETQLTDTPGLDDGPEYSPDGKYIYFNSTRSGMMQLWRMDADGGNPVRLTHDDASNDWFPHPSPDGQRLIWISFGTDVDPAEHPFYKHVTLRTMPIGGGEPRIVAYLYGGQGSINVPSWSPDGTKVAFVSNTAN